MGTKKTIEIQKYRGMQLPRMKKMLKEQIEYENVFHEDIVSNRSYI
jgi:hypothetical protein